jgi:4-hydroxybenzoate polyprenyltransferase
MRFSLPFRALVWWPHLAPPLVGIALFALGTAPDAGLWRLAAFVASLAGTAAFGYFLNDCTDIETDRRAGKRNFAALVPVVPRWGLLLALLLLGGAPWWWLAPAAPLAFGCWVLLVACLVAYSVPPIRLKTRPVPGIFCDMAYGHLLPGLLTLSLFARPGQPLSAGTWSTVALLAFLLVLKGLRNILLHQLQDRAGDKRNGERTFVVKYGGAITAMALNRVLLPLEWLSLLALCTALAPWTTLLLWGLLAYVAVQWLSHALWWDLGTRWSRLYGRFWFWPNDFYEGWFPYLMAVYFLNRQPYPWWWLLVFCAAFPMPWVHLWRDLGSVRRNLRDWQIHFRAYWTGKFQGMPRRD